MLSLHVVNIFIPIKYVQKFPSGFHRIPHAAIHDVFSYLGIEVELAIDAYAEEYH